MATQEIIWNWNNFRGGISDNPYAGQEGQFQDGINVDVQTEPNGFKLTAPIVTYNASVATAPSIILDTSDYGATGSDATIFTFTSYDGTTESKVYKGTSTTAFYTDATGSAIVGATCMWASGVLYIYYFTSIGAIHRLTLGSGTHSVISTALSTSGYCPIINYGGDIYFLNKNTFRKLDSLETLSTIFTSAPENVFTGITFFQDSFHLYSSIFSGTTPRNGQQFIIRLNQTSPDYITKWDRLPILGACNQGSTDYVVTGFGPNYSDVYAVSGTQRQLIKSNFEGMPLGRKFTGQIVSWKDEIFLLGRNKDPLPSTIGNSIFRMGKYFPGMPQALTEIYRGATTLQATCLFAGLTDLYCGHKNAGGNYSVVSLNIDSPCTTYTVEGGYIVSQVYTGGDATLIKHMKEIEISYMCDNTNPYFPHGGTFKLYARKNPIDAWIQIGSSYTKTDIGRIKIVQQEINNANMGDYTQIELQCNISRGSSTLSPLITGIKVTSTININD